jgi:hypothetical protein
MGPKFSARLSVRNLDHTEYATQGTLGKCFSVNSVSNLNRPSGISEIICMGSHRGLQRLC